MRVFRFWWDIPLKTPFHAEYALIPPREVDDQHGRMFEEIMEAVKKTGCSWTLTTIEKKMVETSTGLTENEIFNHTRAT